MDGQFLSKFQGRGIKIAVVKSIRVVKQLMFFNTLRAAAIAKRCLHELLFCLCWAYIYRSLVDIPRESQVRDWFAAG